MIERYSDGLSTIRCFTPDGKASLRFTAVPAKKKAVELVAECGTFGRFHDVSVRGQSCKAVATFLDDNPTSELTAIPEGDEATVGGQACTTLYVESGSRTVRCTKGKAALRVSIAPKPSTAHPARHFEKPQEVADFVAKTKKEPKPATTHGLSPNVTISCTSIGQFTAITSNGVNCAAVTVLLTRYATKLEAVQAGSTTRIGKYACQLISSGNETDTIQCTSPNGASFRATFAQPAAQPPSGGNPPATTTPSASPSPAPDSGGATTPDQATTTPSASTSSPD